ncbi:MAG: hypothetical protein IJ638_01830, partial [Alphaproteobacteria bacterium]|nr:hypothetical protein [Alphaproteobacteria bacterium]
SSTITFDDGSTIQNCNNGVCLNAQELSGNEGATSASSYDFDVSFYGDMKTNVDSLMANVYFEIPGFGSIDPYVGFGYGKSKVKFDYLVPNYDEDGETIVSYDTLSGGSDGYVNAQQFIAGVEYRFDETPLIAGIEYRQFKTDFNEKEDKDPYKFEHKYVMFKLRYDFISDEY